ncbi:hypothetical protein SADUNF_Sadunf11G0102800 [Salix dunnii]|uniref:Uncharacterized protein n=1 Tax=Salix dunnii TaxID=1413687 RepID=A0A835JU29_9ROSI|nr:hypothetical protein SADUNF_Sadunf11G0102800 [Salix dunnii]
MALNSQKWGYVRIITGTLLGGVLGFYVMHRVEVSYKLLRKGWEMKENRSTVPLHQSNLLKMNTKKFIN